MQHQVQILITSIRQCTETFKFVCDIMALYQCRSARFMDKKHAWAGSSNFPTDTANFQQKRLRGPQNFKFCVNFSKIRFLSYIFFAFLHENFPTKNFFDIFLKAQHVAPATSPQMFC